MINSAVLSIYFYQQEVLVIKMHIPHIDNFWSTFYVEYWGCACYYGGFLLEKMLTPKITYSIISTFWNKKSNKKIKIFNWEV